MAEFKKERREHANRRAKLDWVVEQTVADNVAKGMTNVDVRRVGGRIIVRKKPQQAG